jgi:3,4-dihydroxy 2-butanone 4-phosphate synthase/GTP cyclohydrolase II
VPAAESKRRSDAYLSKPEEIIKDASNGRMFILIDEASSTNEGNLIIPAQMATPEAINFMATHGRGLICLAITSERANQLGIHLLTRDSDTRRRGDFATSIEAREGVTTGISTADRAHTIAVAIDGTKGPEYIVTPGHVFPLVARDGGVLVRTGPSEAAVDIARLAGLNPSGVVCAIMNDDGSMAGLDDLIELAGKQDLRIGSISDLIAYRRRNDHLVERRAEVVFQSHWGGEWKAIAFVNKVSGHEVLALQKGIIDPAKPTLVRMHTLSILPDWFGEVSSRFGLIERSMQIIGEEGSGVLVGINRADPDVISRSMRLRREGRGAGDPQVESMRDYGIGAQILSELGVQDMILLTTAHQTLVGLSGYGLSIVGERLIDPASDSRGKRSGPSR